MEKGRQKTGRMISLTNSIDGKALRKIINNNYDIDIGL